LANSPDVDTAKRTFALAAGWGLAEATRIFIVPDVLLSWIAIKRFNGQCGFA